MSKTYDNITAQIIEHIEANPKQWESGLSGIAQTMPVNSKGEHYNGINVLVLWISAERQGFASNQWMTYKQAKDKGAHVKKGQKGTQIIYYKTLEKEDKDTGDITKVPMAKVYTVFNTEQIEELPEDNSIQLYDWNPIESGEALQQSSACEIEHKNVTPCYIPSADRIRIPDQNRFNTAENYYTTLAHEMVHSTMHKTRLDRADIKNRKGYAFEELIAELGAVFTCAKLGIHGDLENHASYIKEWLQAMRNDSRYIFQAAAQASKASDWLLERL